MVVAGYNEIPQLARERKQLIAHEQKLQSTCRALDEVVRQAELKMQQEREDRVELEYDVRRLVEEISQLQGDALLLESQLHHVTQEKRAAAHAARDEKQLLATAKEQLTQKVHGGLSSSPCDTSPSFRRPSRRRFDPAREDSSTTISASSALTAQGSPRQGFAGPTTPTTEASRPNGSI